MDDSAWIIILVFIFGFGLISRRLDAIGLSAPLVFVGFGILCGDHGFGLISMRDDPEGLTSLVDLLAELTLMLVLFGDAARIDLRNVRREAGLPLRMLGVGMPLTILLGAGAAKLCFPELTIWEAGLLGTVLAPTDAALGQAVVSSKEVPIAIRQALNVESGLNDGVALPVVMVFAAVAASGVENTDSGYWLNFWLMQVGLGPVVGIAVALLGGRLATFACSHHAMGETFERIAGLCMALLAYLLAEAVGGNGFISAFVAGLVLGNTAQPFARAVHSFLETEGQLLMIGVFFLVGAIWAFDTFADASALAWIYAVVSLTLIRMIPVALSLLGAGVRWPTTLFLGWFGPRGLATVLFALAVVEREQIAGRELIFSVAMLTVLLSVISHGLSARPGALRYGRWAQRLAKHHPELTSVVEHPTRTDLARPSKISPLP